MTTEDAAFLARRVRTKFLLLTWLEERFALDLRVLPDEGMPLLSGVPDAEPADEDAAAGWLQDRLRSVLQHSASQLGPGA